MKIGLTGFFSIASAILLLATSRPCLAQPKVLFIGDSHSVMQFGHSLVEALGPQVQRYAVAAAAAGDWNKPYICAAGKPCGFIYGYSTPKGDRYNRPVPSDFKGLRGLLRSTQARAVIVALGTNDANQRCHLNPDQRMNDIQKLLATIGSRRCYWVGPPIYKEGPLADQCGPLYEDFVSQMKETIQSHCTFIDSREIIDPSTSKPIQSDLEDQIHFSPELSVVWAREAAKQIK